MIVSSGMAAAPRRSSAGRPESDPANRGPRSIPNLPTLVRRPGGLPGPPAGAGGGLGPFGPPGGFLGFPAAFQLADDCRRPEPDASDAVLRPAEAGLPVALPHRPRRPGRGADGDYGARLEALAAPPDVRRDP